MRRLTISLALAAVLAGCHPLQQQRLGNEPRRLTDPVTGGRFHLFVSGGYRRGRPAPLIVSCHGAGRSDTAERHADEWRWLAEQHGCVLVCPELGSPAGSFGPETMDRLLDDERLTLSIINALHYLYDIDWDRVMITGSAGGGLPTYFVGLRHPELFRVVAARGCNFHRQILDGWHSPDATATPVMVSYGDSDPAAVRGQSEDAVKYLRSAGFQVTTAIYRRGEPRGPERAMRFFLEHRQAASAPARTQPASGPAATAPQAEASPRP